MKSVPESVRKSVHVNRNKVLKLLLGIEERTSPGPDGICGHILKHCAEELVDIFCYIFERSSQRNGPPRLRKDSIIVPVPKNTNPKSLNNYRPVALTCLVMTVFEKVVKDELLKSVQDKLDPLQFAYRHNRGVEDATNTIVYDFGSSLG